MRQPLGRDETASNCFFRESNINQSINQSINHGPAFIVWVVNCNRYLKKLWRENTRTFQKCENSPLCLIYLLQSIWPNEVTSNRIRIKWALSRIFEVRGSVQKLFEWKLTDEVIRNKSQLEVTALQPKSEELLNKVSKNGFTKSTGCTYI